MPSIRLPATGEAFERYKERPARLIRRWVSDRFDAEDILHDVLYEFLESGDSGDSAYESSDCGAVACATVGAR